MSAATTISLSRLLSGIIVETNAESLTGSVLYSDVRHTKLYPTVYYGRHESSGEMGFHCSTKHYHVAPSSSYLNRMAQIPVIGIIAGITRVALGALHTIGHLFKALITQNKGHLWHAAKGGCEMIRGLIETIPVIGRIFANTYGIRWHLNNVFPQSDNKFCWWMIKMYNPEKPDALDSVVKNWNNFPRSHYVKV